MTRAIGQTGNIDRLDGVANALFQVPRTGLAQLPELGSENGMTAEQEILGEVGLSETACS